MSLVGKKIGNYNITRLLGEGGMGAVYLGEHPLIGKKVAVKVLHDDLATKSDIVSRFFTEAKAVNDIHHENIVDIVDFGQMKDETGKELVYFLMELLEGDSLNARVKRGPLSHEETVHIMDQCCSALAASHSHGIVHRDLKPDNIYLITRGHDRAFVKILDFGIAKLTGGQAAAGMTRAGAVIGTPAYMSPEQCDGRGNIDHRSDVYSLGVVMYELLCGRVPFVGEGFGEVLVAQLTTPPPRPSDLVQGIPPGLEAIVLRCLEKSRDLRFQSMDELREALMTSGSYVPPRPLTGMNKIINTDASTVVGVQAQRPTTLSGAAGEVTGGAIVGIPTKSKAPLFAVLGMLVVGAGGAGAYFGLFHKDPPPVLPVVVKTIVEKTVEPKDESVSILIDSVPQGAEIRRAGIVAPIGKTPFELEVKKSDATFDVMLALEGYQPQTKTVSSDRDHDLSIALLKDEPTPVVQPPVVHSHHDHPRKDDGMQLLTDPEKVVKKVKPDKPGPDRPADPDGVLAPKL